MLDEVTSLTPADLLAAQLDGCLFRHELDITIIHALRTVALGESWFTRPVVEWLYQPPPTPVLSTANLSKREWQVLALLADGLSNKEIAQKLSIAAHTVERHLSQLYQKLNVRSRAEAGKWYWQHRPPEK